MTITIPTWLLWLLCGVGGVLLMIALVLVGLSAWIGWLVTHNFRPHNG